VLVRGFQRVKNVAINTLKKEYYLTNLEGVSYPLSRAIFWYKKTKFEIKDSKFVI